MHSLNSPTQAQSIDKLTVATVIYYKSRNQLIKMGTLNYLSVKKALDYALMVHGSLYVLS